MSYRKIHADAILSLRAKQNQESLVQQQAACHSEVLFNLRIFLLYLNTGKR